MEKLLIRKREINDRLTELEARELTAEQQNEYDALQREWNQLNRQIELLRVEREAQPAAPNRSQQFRETLQAARHSVQREIIVGTADNPGAGLNSGAINLTVADLTPTTEAGTELPSAIQIVEGVVGDVVFPTDATDLEIEEAGEVAVLDDQVIDFDSVKAVPARVTVSCDISNKMIDNLAFDILPNAMGNIAKANRKFLAKKIYSPAAFTGLKGGFSGLTSAGTITIGQNTAAEIMAAIAQFTDKGFDASSLCVVIDAATEATLKVTPVAKGQGGFIIQDGKLLGYEYRATHYINTKLNEDGALVTSDKKHIGFGLFQYLKVQQHGEYRLTMDGVSKAQAKKNCVGLTLNTEYSITDLSQHIHNQEGEALSAFAIYDLA